MVWGAIGGVVGFVTSLLGSLVGILVAAFIGLYCGSRAADADGGRRAGALSGLISGAVAAPVYALGASAGSLVTARRIGSQTLATTLSDMLGMQISPDEAWQLFLLSMILASLVQMAILISASVAAGAWRTRK